MLLAPPVFDLPHYVPSRRWRGGHLMTVYAWARARHLPRLPEPEACYFDTDTDARVLAHCNWQPQRDHAPALLLLHGLEGSSLAHYMRGIADKAWNNGFSVVRLNQRNCGGTEHLSRGLYHSGLTHDPLFLLRHMIEKERVPAVVVAGYSLGGNLTLKLAGDLGGEAPPQLKAICAVSPTMDLARCVDALERRSNVLYQFNFMRNLRARMHRKAALFPDIYDLARLKGVWTVRGFDDAYTAPLNGFGTAARYYHEASSLRVVDRIRVPTLVLTAANDPFVPPDQFARPEIAGNPHVRVVVTKDGGHCAFVSEPDPAHDGYWAEHAIVKWALEHAPTRKLES
jgi:predicted alpha/beta-fold hydrolase